MIDLRPDEDMPPRMAFEQEVEQRRCQMARPGQIPVPRMEEHINRVEHEIEMARAAEYQIPGAPNDLYVWIPARPNSRDGRYLCRFHDHLLDVDHAALLEAGVIAVDQADDRMRGPLPGRSGDPFSGWSADHLTWPAEFGDTVLWWVSQILAGRQTPIGMPEAPRVQVTQRCTLSTCKHHRMGVFGSDGRCLLCEASREISYQGALHDPFQHLCGHCGHRFSLKTNRGGATGPSQCPQCSTPVPVGYRPGLSLVSNHPRQLVTDAAAWVRSLAG